MKSKFTIRSIENDYSAETSPTIKSCTRRNVHGPGRRDAADRPRITAMRAMRVHAPRVPLACDTLPDPAPGPGQVLVAAHGDLHLSKFPWCVWKKASCRPAKWSG